MNTTFKIGKTYQVRSLGNWDCIFSFEVYDRTEQFVFVNDGYETSRRKIVVRDGVETCKPCGTFSMAPTIRADREFV